MVAQATRPYQKRDDKMKLKLVKLAPDSVAEADDVPFDNKINNFSFINQLNDIPE